MVIWFYRSYDYRPNWTPLSPITTIINIGLPFFKNMHWFHLQKVTNALPAAEEDDDDDDDDEEGGDLSKYNLDDEV